MNLHLELDDEKFQRLQVVADRLNVSVDDLARAAISELLNQPDDDFETAASRVLAKNEELYRRLS